MYSNLEVILVSTKYPQNMGFVARAIKNMGFTSLKLVNPTSYDPKELKLYAVHADDILDSMCVYNNLSEAIESTAYSIGFTTRKRKNMDKCVVLSDIIPSISDILKNQKIAVIFGAEDTGLSNAELELCQMWVKIPASELFPSINLAQAVMIVLYELFTYLGSNEKGEDGFKMVSIAENAYLYSYMEDTFNEIKITSAKGHQSWANSIRKILDKRQLTQAEANTIIGFLTELRKLIK